MQLLYNNYFGINCTSLKGIGDGATSEAIALIKILHLKEQLYYEVCTYVVEQLQLRLQGWGSEHSQPS